tara:strand:+ start:1024 stop:1569 length:546 start_codon:yes stop_codon:yes gene_type:complete
MYKKSLLSIAFAMAVSVTVFAQTSQTANLNITLSSVLSMTISGAEITVDFDDATKYSDGITSTVANHLTVTSNRPYTVSAIAGVVSGGSSLSPNDVKLTTVIGTGNAGNTTGLSYTSGTAIPTAASGASIDVVTATNSSWNGNAPSNTFDVTYLIGANGAFTNKTLASDNIIPVIYTVVAN